jgi:oxygen-independent coproporphyrinogen-3 oxidase
MDKKIIDKYNVPGPRYTSYPTVPFWKNDPLSSEEWLTTIQRNKAFFNSSDISVYVHLPFCESLCTFCGCHKRITKNHDSEFPYVNAVLKEWEMYHEKLNMNPTIRELHFGGGTPTFFSPSELIRLLKGLFKAEKVDPEFVELSIEAHPTNTTDEHLTELFTFGFRRLSLGIQDYSPVVQKAIHRIQSFDQVKAVHNKARQMGYKSISHDLVFGLPKQTLEDISDTVTKTLELRPDRISLYSYAHVPWVKGNGQRGFDASDLPKSEVKRELYEKAKSMLEAEGYKEIGMDHFALAHDDLSKAFNSKTLHRNFMGYTTQDTNLMIGLGMSAISDSWFGFAQNDKSVEGYVAQIEKGQLPVFRGHLLSELDVEIRQYILDLMCHFETEFKSDSKFKEVHTLIKKRLKGMISDGLVGLQGEKVTVTPEGIPFVRNCCMIFDQDLEPNTKLERMFSQTI